MVTDANTLMKLPEVVDSMTYDEDVAITEPTFLERAEFLHERGYYKELTIQELREKLRVLYREKMDAKPVEPEDVWK